MPFTLYQGDCLEVMRGLPDASVDSVITDPPYGLAFMGKEWDHGIPGVPFWEQALRVAKPGAVLLAFGGTRTFHRLTCAIEDAGWEIRDCVMWLYGSGFPKSLDIGKALERNKSLGSLETVYKVTAWIRERRDAQGLTNADLDAATNTYMAGHWTSSKSQPAIPTLEQWRKLEPLLGKPPAWMQRLILPANAPSDVWHTREVIGQDTKARSTNGKSALPTMGAGVKYETWDITAPATPLAQQWDGWGTALKPAWEPIIVAMKPLDGTFAQNAARHGVAGLWIDGSRIGTEEQGIGWNGLGHTHDETQWRLNNPDGIQRRPSGRWPANLLLDEAAAAALDEMSGELKSGGGDKSRKGDTSGSSCYGIWGPQPLYIRNSDTGGASRYFKVLEADRFFYCAKASRAERNRGLEGMPERENRPLGISNWEGQTNGSGEKMGKSAPQQNGHPCVKPLALLEYLCTLTRTPTGGIVLDPFMGSGSTGVACVNTGRDFIGIELQAEYVEIARRRIAHAEEQARQLPLEEAI